MALKDSKNVGENSIKLVSNLNFTCLRVGKIERV